MTRLRNLLSSPSVYHYVQCMGGWFGARVRTFDAYLDFGGIRRVFDIGCGPGHIVAHIPSHVEYVGFDTDEHYIAYANDRFGRRGRFLARPFDRTAAGEFGTPDLVLMNGVLHHMDDKTALSVIADVHDALDVGGKLLTLDGCLEDGQPAISRYLIEHDRGQFVRTRDGYAGLVTSRFRSVEAHVRGDLSWVPYTFLIMCATKSRAA